MLFKGTHINRLDAKGRVSIPAPFRAILRAQATDGVPCLVLKRSVKFDCIEGWPARAFDEMQMSLQQMAPYSPEHDDFAQAFFGDALDAEPDKEGRIVLPGELAAYAKLTDNVTFLGNGRTFQIWEPAAAAARLEASRANARHIMLPPLTMPRAQVPA